MSKTDLSDKEKAFAAKREALKEKARLLRKEAYQKAKERQKQYLASPAVQARIASRKDALKQKKKEKSLADRNRKQEANREASAAFKEGQKKAREDKQHVRDEELRASIRPALTLIQGGNQPSPKL